MNLRFRRLFFAGVTSMVCLINTLAVGNDIVPDRKTPGPFKSAAGQFEQAKSKAMRAVQVALKQEGQNGTAKINALVGDIEKLADLAQRNISRLEAQLDDYDGEAREAMVDLKTQYEQVLGPINKAKASASAMLNLHQRVRGIVEFIEIEKENSQRRLQECSARAKLISQFVTVVATKMLKQTGSTGIGDAIKNTQSHEVLAEALAVFVFHEKQKINELLDEVNPAREIANLRSAGDGLNGVKGSWDDAHDRWRAALQSHAGDLNSAVSDFKSRVKTRWIRFYIDYSQAKVSAVKETARDLISFQRQRRLEAKAEIREAEEDLEETQEDLTEVRQELDEKKAELATLLARQALIKLQIKESAGELESELQQENREVHNKIDAVNRAIEDYNKTASAALQKIAEIRKLLKQLDP